MVMAGDLNLRHDQLSGTGELPFIRYGGAGRITESMRQTSLSSLSPRGANSGHDKEHAQTIGFFLSSERLVEGVMRSGNPATDHGSGQ